MSKEKKKRDMASRRKLRKARKTAERGPAREKRWDERYREGAAEEIQAPFQRIVSRRDRRRREIELAREMLREKQLEGAGEASPDAVEGVIIEIVPGGCIVKSDGAETRCVLRGLLKSLETRESHVIAVGDRVLFLPLEDGSGVIERVFARITVLSRKYMEREHVVAVNVDQLVIIASVDDPPLRTGLIDRYVVAAENGALEPVILLNKMDLATGDSPRRRLQVYAELGYRVVLCSAKTGEGLDDVKELLRGKSSIFAGQSGVGKSTILNALQPGLRLRVGEVSETTRKGIHTTTSVTLLSLDFGGYVVDTPGIREFALWDIAPEDLPYFFPEFEPYVGTCKLRGCTHTHEPGCEVKHALEEGRINRDRYDSYCRIMRSLK
jgi:ribosome biogenesis GTPase